MAKIFIVDDVEDNIKLLWYNLEDDGHEVASAMSGQECLDKAPGFEPDVILLDMMMPGMSGIETLTALKALPAMDNIPVIMVSANDSDDSIIDALDQGAHDFISKPFIYPVLEARVRSAVRLKQSQEELEAANGRLAMLASTDSLTQCVNRRQFFELSGSEFAKAKRHAHPLSVIMLDADKFKAINDTYGHAMGDEALLRIADVARGCIRESDILARLGGEEFAICCPGSTVDGAIRIAERIREAIAKEVIECNGQTAQFTVSMGVTEYTGAEQAFDQLLNRADRLLYRAKEEGRNRVISGV
ncbi:GGDEF domain-containing response regulator [Simiduia agarivorans]|uniref:diguanylate cyclase n=1 Tax=Simiduia agarivorans (strain DSM 21679 / JCM 13881 / BCRC 17597 / SA1) TaxID=1117647 RepID=K4KXV1_SIMAS|nr:diguanylate cyclase [Simiduia agarivorans]AFU98752.1 response regulator receiver modulated diguanylate cyclase [Simiduia agarivorans SA1 = DSM 21679]